jgi:hypothetical protein
MKFEKPKFLMSIIMYKNLGVAHFKNVPLVFISSEY